MAEDVRFDLVSFEMNVGFGERMSGAADVVLAVYDGYDPPLSESDQVAVAILRASFLGDVSQVANRATYDDLINTGNLDLLPLDVQDALAAYYAEKERYRVRDYGQDEQLRNGYYRVPPQVLGPRLLPDLWLQLSNLEGTGAGSEVSLQLSQEEFRVVIERLRAYPTLLGDLAQAKHFATQKQEIYGKRLPAAAVHLLTTLEQAGVDTGEPAESSPD